ncbi:HAD family hydrolase [Patescibacteria group bacterium]
MNKDFALIKRLQKTDTFIFDFDGTVVDTNKLNFVTFKEPLERITRIRISDEDFGKCFAGLPSKKSIPAFLGQAGVKSTKIIKQVIKEHKSLKKKLLETKPRAYLKLTPGVFGFLKRLKIKNKQVILATSTRRTNVRRIFSIFNLRKFFDYIITIEDVKKPKPDPEVYLRAQELSGSKQNSSLVFEDSKNGILAAQAAGLFCVGFSNGGFNENDLQSADAIIDTFESIIEEV